MNLLMIGINIVVFVIMEILGSTEDTGFMLQWGAACRPLILDGEWYRLFTSMFLHFGIYHLVNNMAVLLFMGDMVEKAVGHWKYLMIYLGSGLVGNLLSLYMDIQSQSNIVSAGASGAIYGIIGGVFVLMIKNRKQVREVVIRRLVFVIAVTIYYGSQAAQIDNAAHVGGLIGGIVLTVLFTLHWNHSRKGYVAE
ncbi:rhomboid family intramembrane serine protease [Blautia faecicola]|uniref:Rhomboid family intramembrane serine protease n=2 Tax=Blautia faecicola TaxID=2509240 RepID=A0A4Q1RLS2_9FIRM|nr:rhomboid family intramembrane serine protease [Blautia faecicola]